jgi:hypothetical protein
MIMASKRSDPAIRMYNNPIIPYTILSRRAFLRLIIRVALVPVIPDSIAFWVKLISMLYTASHKNKANNTAIRLPLIPSNSSCMNNVRKKRLLNIINIENIVHQFTEGKSRTNIFRKAPIPHDTELKPGSAFEARYLAMLPSPAKEYTGSVKTNTIKSNNVIIPDTIIFFFIAIPL